MMTEENFFDFKCPGCGETVSYPQSAAGCLRECINCLQELIVPEPGSEVARTIPIPVETPRLILRRFEAGDVEALAALAADEEFFLHSAGSETEQEEEVSRWLEQQRQIKLTTPQRKFALAIVTRTGAKLIGYVGWIVHNEVEATIDVELHRNYQHQGFALEAVDALLGFCFDVLRLHRVIADCESSNTAACRLFERVGMRREGESLKARRLADGSWANVVWFAALEEEYGRAEEDPTKKDSSA